MDLTPREAAGILRRRAAKGRAKLQGPKLAKARAKPRNGRERDAGFMAWLHDGLPCIACLRFGATGSPIGDRRLGPGLDPGRAVGAVMTPSPEALAELERRVREATGGNRNLFLAVARAVVPDYAGAIEWRTDFNAYLAVRAWEQAALALCERVLPGTAWSLGKNVHHGHWVAFLNVLDAEGAPRSIGWSDGTTPALALLAAMLLRTER